MDQLNVAPTVVLLLGIDGSKLVGTINNLGQTLLESSLIAFLAGLGSVQVKIRRIAEVTLEEGKYGRIFGLYN